MIFKECKYKSWLTDATFDNCLLERKEFGEFIASYIIGEHDGFVLNLNGAWGSGKTEFIKRLYSHLLTLNHPTIYIDAWESDFSKEPLTVVASELLNQMTLLHDDIIGLEETIKVKGYLAKVMRGAVVGAAGLGTKYLINDASIGVAMAEQVLGEEVKPSEYVDKLASDYKEQVEAIHFIRESLGELAEVLSNELDVKLPVVVLVDELDRCRPDYAIEMLEVIKHFFTTNNFVFVVASDTNQLCRSIKNVYGAEFDSEQYLKRFFDRKACLPEPKLKLYLQTKVPDFSQYESLYLFPNTEGNLNDFVHSVINNVVRVFNLKLRDVDQLINKMESCLRTAVAVQEKSGLKQYINLIVLLVGLIEFDYAYDQYLDKSNESLSVPNIHSGKSFYVYEQVPINLYLRVAMYSVATVLRKDSRHGIDESYTGLRHYTEFYDTLDAKRHNNLSSLAYRYGDATEGGLRIINANFGCGMIIKK